MGHGPHDTTKPATFLQGADCDILRVSIFGFKEDEGACVRAWSTPSPARFLLHGRCKHVVPISAARSEARCMKPAAKDFPMI